MASLETEISLTDQLLSKIEHMILNKEVKWGDRINEKELSERWGVSRTPVREACRIMQQAGIVDIIKNKGVVVRKIRLQDILHLFDIRAALERLAAMQATEYITKMHSRYLTEIIEKMSVAGSEQNADEYMHLNTLFHKNIYKLSQNHPLIKLQDDLLLQLRLFRRAIQTEGNFLSRNNEHKQIYKALIAGDAELAGLLSEQHLIKSKARFLDAIDSSEKMLDDIIERKEAIF